jgi:hypothetical protein
LFGAESFIVVESANSRKTADSISDSENDGDRSGGALDSGDNAEISRLRPKDPLVDDTGVLDHNRLRFSALVRFCSKQGEKCGEFLVIYFGVGCLVIEFGDKDCPYIVSGID